MKRMCALATISLMIRDQADRRLLAEFLQQTGYDVECVTAAELEDGHVKGSLLIVDETSARYRAPALMNLKACLQPLYLPILLSLPGSGRATPWLRAGFDDVLRLPMNKDDLLARLEAFLRLRRHSEQILNESDLRYRATFDLAPAGMVHATLEGRLTLVNQRFCEMLEYTRDEVLGRPLVDLVDQDQRAQLQATIDRRVVDDGDQRASIDVLYRRRDQSLIWTVVTISLAPAAGVRPMHLIIVIEDIGERKAMEQALQESERFIRSTIDALSEHICVIDMHGQIIAVNQAWREFGVVNGRVMRFDWTTVNYLAFCDAAASRGIEDSRLLAQGMRNVLSGARTEFSMEYPCHETTEPRWFAAKLTRFPLDGPVRMVIALENITQAKHAERHLSYLAHYDNLTGLPNRILFYDRLRQTLRQAERSKWTVAVMFIDLDHFKMINDTLGHAAGDLVLREASHRIVDGLRSNDTVGRLGGDEFCVFMPDLAIGSDAAKIASKLLSALSAPFNIDGAEAFVTASIGITLYPHDGTDADRLVSSADTAMYRAKEQGRNNSQFFTQHMNAVMLEHARLGNGLRKAIERDELYLEYQPQIDIETGIITGVEALLRWRHAQLGVASPATFIPVAEETGLIVSIGEWAMRTACAQNMTWQSAGIAPIVMAVNLSARQFKHTDMNQMVRQVLEDTGMEGQYLELELTEGIVMENAEVLIATMNRLKECGVRLSLDDFGTGFSNLGYLKRFPLDMIKIDRSFVNGLGKGSDEGLIAAMVITLGHSLKLKVIAEGVETENQLAVLQALGCDMMQGFLFSRPLPVSQITALLQKRSKP